MPRGYFIPLNRLHRSVSGGKGKVERKIVFMKSVPKVLLMILAFAVALIIYCWKFYGAATATKIGSLYVSLATIIGAIAAIIGVFWAIRNVTGAIQAYKDDRSMRKKEVINKLYEKFLEEDVYELYEKVKANQPFELNTGNKRALNKALTLFDELEYFESEKLFDEKLWEYIGCEIVNLSCHKNVQQFLRETWEQYKPKNKAQEDMMPFTGFKELVKKLPNPYWFKKKPNLEEDANG
jgi:hypothetical protein